MPKQDERIQLEQIDTVEVVTLMGSFDMDDSMKLDESLKDLIQRGSKKLLIDLTSVSYMVSTAFRAIVNAQVRLALINGELKIVCPMGGAVRRALKVTRLDGVLELFESRHAAMAAFNA